MKKRYADYTLKWATTQWEYEQARAIRRAVFCDEQGLFDDDEDAIDHEAHTLVAIANVGGEPDCVVGTVRLHRSAERTWWGSRLAIARPFRSQVQLGGALIQLAVRSANTLGCDNFYATVQPRNVPLFEKLSWVKQGEVIAAGKPHVSMEADLNAYPVFTGDCRFVLKAKAKPPRGELAPALMQLLQLPAGLNHAA